jgi:hypothetical protein
MPGQPRDPRPLNTLLRAVIEVAFIIFLFYANLLMGEFNRANGVGKTLASALHDIITLHNFGIALFAAIVGYIVFETLRKKL